MHAIDSAILDALMAARDPLITYGFLWITFLGQAAIVYGLTGGAMLLLVLKRHFAYALSLAIAVASTGVLILILKGLLERPRPPIEFQAYLETWHSFPSAHAALGMALYGALAILALRLMPRGVCRYLVTCLFGFLVVLIAFSRVYLGVHYPSDVFAGLLVGAACVWLGLKYEKIVGNGHS